MLRPFTSPFARAILWAQYRGLRNRFPRANVVSVLFTAVIGILWYGLITAAAIAIGVLMAAGTSESLERILPGGLLLVFLYWLFVPLLMASKGASLELRKLMVYPVPRADFFRLEMLLRLTAGLEPLIVTAGAFVGLLFNRGIPIWGPLALVVFVLFTMFSATGMHELLGRLMMRKGVREIAALLFVITVALPQMILIRTNPRHFRWLTTVTGSYGWPWSATAQIALGRANLAILAVLLAWTIAAYIFGRLQFDRTLRYDAAATSTPILRGKRARRLEWFFRWPNLVFRDPLAAMVEKEIRFLVRASRFRMVFVMGFSFGFLIWWPMAFGQRHADSTNFMSQNFTAIVSLYAVLLLTDVLFWNVFGFDRSAAQLYFVVPVKTETVLRAKNVAAAFFVLLETTIALAICVAIRLPVTVRGLAEAYAVTIVAMLLLLPIGNLTSLYSPRALDPSKALRASRGGRVQALMLVVYPIVAVPLVLAYAARYAFNSEVAFYAVLGLAVVFAIIVYRIAMESAIAMAGTKKEAIVAALSRGEGPVE